MGNLPIVKLTPALARHKVYAMKCATAPAITRYALVTNMLLLVSITPAADNGTGTQAVLYVSPKQDVGYLVCLDGSQSRGMNPMGTNDIYGIRNYRWQFGDGTPEQSSEYLPTVTHTFNKAGTYAILLTVTDFAHRTSGQTANVQVTTLPKVQAVKGDLTQAIRSLKGQPGIVAIPLGEFAPGTVNVPAGVIIEGAGVAQTRLRGVLFQVQADNVRITGLEIAGRNGNSWLYQHGCHNLYVDHCDMHGHGEATRIGQYASATFEENHIHDNDQGLGYGIEVTTGAYAMVRRNRFERNRHSIAGGGKSGHVLSEYESFPTGYDFLENQVRFEPQNHDVAVDMHPTGHGRVRITKNTFAEVSSAIGLKDGWGEI